MKNCKLCPVACGADRSRTKGYCGAGENLSIAKYYLHKYEEPVLSGTNGSGTVFFTGCSLRCAFCQNYAVSRAETGKEITPKELADIFIKLEDAGAHNINLVTPTQYVPQICEAFGFYRPKIPVVYNTHAYEPTETLALIDLYVDVYLPDLKFYTPEISARYTSRKDYFAVASEAVKFMMSRKKTVIEDGLMKSGVIVRHLVMPEGAKESRKIIDWFSENATGDAYLSLMAQYTPFGDYKKFPELRRPVTKREYDGAVEYAISKGVENCFIQQLGSAKESFIPEWDF